MTDQVAEFRSNLDILRQAFARMLEVSLGHNRSAGSCAYACVMVQSAIANFHPHWHVVIRGGDGQQDGGFFAADGQGHGHYWVEVQGLDNRNWVVDIVADQFGLEPIQFGTTTDLADRYRPGDQAAVDEQISEFVSEIEDDKGTRA